MKGHQSWWKDRSTEVLIGPHWVEFQGKDEGRPLIGWCLELNFTEVLIGPRWVKSDPLGGPNSNVHSTPLRWYKIAVK